MKLANLDSLRAIAAIIVIIFHLSGEYPGMLPWFASFGWVGVDLFFVISGAVVAYSADSLSKEKFDSWRHEYFVRRFARIYPLYIFSSVVFLIASADFWAQGMGKIILQIITHITMTHSFMPATFYGLNHVTWSLGIEVQYYIIIAVIFTQAHRAPIFAIAFIALSVSYLWNYFVRVFVPGNDPEINFYLSQLFGRIDEFGWGLMIWRLWKTRQMQTLSKINVILLYLLSIAIIFIGVILFISWCAAVSGKSGFISSIGMYLHLTLGNVGVRMMIGLSCALVVFGATLLPRSKIYLPLEALGKISYGLYLWHPIAIIITIRYMHQSDAIGITISLVLTAILAQLSWSFFELPSRRWIISKLVKKQMGNLHQIYYARL